MIASWEDLRDLKKLDSLSRTAGFIQTMKVFKLTKAEKQDFCESLRQRLLGRTQRAPKAIGDPSDRI